MTNCVNVREIISYKISKGKKECRKLFKNNFMFLILCWSITGVVAFSSWGVYVFVDFAGYFLGLTTDFSGAAIALFTFLPLLFGNIHIFNKIIKGEKADIYMLFECFFNFKKFWKFMLMYVIYLSPMWCVALISAVVANNTKKFIPFANEDILFYISLVFEILTLVLVFLNLCKSLYFFSAFNMQENENTFFIKTSERYSKKKKYFKKYVVSHFHYVIFLFLAGLLPLYATALIYVFVLGYIALSFSAFSEGFRIKFKKNKIRRTERYER